MHGLCTPTQASSIVCGHLFTITTLSSGKPCTHSCMRRLQLLHAGLHSGLGNIAYLRAGLSELVFIFILFERSSASRSRQQHSANFHQLRIFRLFASSHRHTSVSLYLSPPWQCRLIVPYRRLLGWMLLPLICAISTWLKTCSYTLGI